MGYLRAVLAVLLMASVSSVYGGSCFEKPYDADDCRQKAEQGNDVAQGMLGVMYESGKGVVQNDKEAVKWFRMSSEQGNPASQYRLALMYERGQGVVQDYKEAVKWWRKAVEQGHPEAPYTLGLKYTLGKGVIRDDVMAHMYFNIAAVSGHEDAIKMRGLFEKMMTASQLEKAQDLAREWIRIHQ